MQGIIGRKPPLWAIILDMAGGDPLRAQEIEEHLTAEWYHYAVAYNKAKARARKDSG